MGSMENARAMPSGITPNRGDGLQLIEPDWPRLAVVDFKSGRRQWVSCKCLPSSFVHPHTILIPSSVLHAYEPKMDVRRSDHIKTIGGCPKSPFAMQNGPRE